MNLFGMDPGSTNFGYGAVQTKLVNGKHKFRVRECGILAAPLKSIKPEDLKKGRARFLKSVAQVMLPNSELIGERYQTRGGKGVTIELVNFMLAFVYSEYLDKDLRMVTAAQWKHWVNKSASLAKLVKKVSLPKSAAQTPLSKLYKYSGCEAHEVDAVLMALFLSYTKRGLVPFADMTLADWQSLAGQCGAVSTIETTQKRLAKRS